MENKSVTVDIKVDIPLERIKDLLVTAFEGGCNYWLWLGMHRRDAYKAILEEGKSIDIYDSEDSNECLGSLSLEKIVNALKLLAKGETAKGDKRSHFTAQFETADILIQLAMFGEIIYE